MIRVINRLIYSLNKVKEKLQHQKALKELDDWKSKFKDREYVDHQITSNSKIRLYQDSVLSKLMYDGFENNELNYLRNKLKNGDTFIDIGANIGLFSIIASEIVGPNGKVISFEPSPITFKRLKENCELNNTQNIEIKNIGLSDNIGKLDFYISDNGYDAWNSFAKSHDDKLKNKIEVSVSTLDNELEKFDAKNVSLIKIDVEGWEKFVLLGGLKFLQKNSPTLLIEFTEQNTYNAGYWVHDLFEILESIGYKWYRITNGTISPENKKLHYPYDNLIAQRN
jgi:FkbM family methyltransferase